jgi:hypothetical protein
MNRGHTGERLAWRTLSEDRGWSSHGCQIALKLIFGNQASEPKQFLCCVTESTVWMPFALPRRQDFSLQNESVKFAGDHRLQVADSSGWNLSEIVWCTSDTAPVRALHSKKSMIKSSAEHIQPKANETKVFVLVAHLT